MTEKGVPEGGTRRFAYADPPTLVELIVHAEQFGSHMVFETATEYLSPGDLMKLTSALDDIDKRANEGRRVYNKKPPRRLRPDRETMRRLVAQYTEDRIPQKRIAEHLGIGVTFVKKLLKEGSDASQSHP